MHGLQPPSFLFTIWRGEDQGEKDLWIIPVFSIAENSSLAAASFSRSNRLGLANTGGPGLVSRWWRTPLQGFEAVNPPEDKTSGNSFRSFWICCGAKRKHTDIFRAVGMDHFTALNINQKVKMLEKICSKKRDRYWLQAGSSKYISWSQSHS